MRTISFTVLAPDHGKTVKSQLRSRLKMAEIMISRIKLREDGILCNGERVFTNARVCAGDIISVRIDDTGGFNSAEPMSVPLHIVFEDDDLAVINKSGDMAVHGSSGGNGVTLANALAYCWGREQVFHPVNRLDRGTSGLMVVAKNAYIHDRLRNMLHSDDFVREYIAIIHGYPRASSGLICVPIGKDPKAPTKRIAGEGLPSETKWQLLGSNGTISAVRLRPLTGRTHQIRVHLAAAGHPIVGDTLYGDDETDVIHRPALHSGFLRVRHPVTGQWIEYDQAVPPDMDSLLKNLKISRDR